MDFLRTLGLEEEYESRFGATRRACGGVPAHNDGNAAVWLWQHSLPVDRLIEHFAAQPFAWSIVPHRFSIGAVVFERGLWETMSGFPLRTPAPGLGDDEESLCAQCLSTSRVMTVVHDVYAGHFAFGLQTNAMRRAFEARLGDF